jgi:cell division protein FtsB
VTVRTLERDRPRLTGRAGLLLLIVLMLGMYGSVPLREVLERRAQAAELERKVAALEAANAKLLADIAKLREPVYLEQLARGCLAMVAPGETRLVLDAGSEYPPAGPC